MRPKALELLIALAASEGRPLDKAELLDRIWGKVHVTEDSLFQAVKDAAAPSAIARDVCFVICRVAAICSIAR